MSDYASRTLTETVRRASETFPVVLLTGPRQVGKTTLLQSLGTEERDYVTLDDYEQRDLARKDPELFLQSHRLPLLIDEIQYAPELFRQIKIVVDRERKPGLFWLTGSQKFHLMQGVSESLAGRVAILDLLGLSQSEVNGRSTVVYPFLPTTEWVDQAQSTQPPAVDVGSLYHSIWLGGFPKLRLDRKMSRELFFKSYIQTYIERDVRALANVGSETHFYRFLQAAAARTGQLVNYADLARDVDTDQKTVKSWLSILEASGLIFLLQPYHSNVSKRLLKTPKLYFLDTGLCAYLTRWSSPDALEAGAMSGAILETYLISEILKSYWHRGKEVNVYFYRDRNQKEIDLLIEEDQTVFPVEFKKSASPGRGAAQSFAVLDSLSLKRGDGGVVCLKSQSVRLSREALAIPVSFLG